MNDLFSMRAIAEALQVSTRTIQRAVESGSIPWHGKRKRGRYAEGITLADATAWARQQDRRAPAWTKAAGRLGDDWRSVMGPVLSAAAGGADIDLIAAAVRVIRTGLRLSDFRDGLQGGNGDGFGYDLAEAMLAAGSGESFAIPKRATFRQTWRALQRLAYDAPVNVQPGIIVAFNGKLCRSVSIGLSPAWPQRGKHKASPSFLRTSIIPTGAALRVVPGLQAALNALPQYVKSPGHWKRHIGPILEALRGGMYRAHVERLPAFARAGVPLPLLEKVAAGLRVLRGPQLQTVGGVITDTDGKETRLVETLAESDVEAWRRLVNRRTVADMFGVSRQAVRPPRIARR